MSEWTYCKDKMPEEYVWYMVAHLEEGSPITDVACLTKGFLSGKISWSEDDVYAWMPLPDPPPVPEGT